MNKIETIGIIGGGQLGMMMTEAAHKLGFKAIVLDPTPHCSCGQIAESQIVAEYSDLKSIEQLCQQSDVVTYEFENIPYQVIEAFQKNYYIPQGYQPLYYSQHRIREKQAAQKAGALCGNYAHITCQADFEKAIDDIQFPAVLKTCSGGYDGKGQLVIRSKDDFDEAAQIYLHTDCILEKFIPFDFEISVIATRSVSGELSILPIGKNIHRNNILHMTIHPFDIAPEVIQNAVKTAQLIMNNLEIIGTMAIEMFVVGAQVFFNEMAPRPHNSGHFSIEACYTSQFEQHVRAITGMPLGNTDLKCHSSIMVNVLGQDYEGMKKLEQRHLQNVYIHDYHKAESRYNRKMAHVTFIDYAPDNLQKILQQYWA